MPKPKRLVDATAQLTTSPPDLLPAGHVIAQVVGNAGKNLYNVQLPAKTSLLVELAPQFRNSFWLRKGGFVVVDTGALSKRDNKLGGEIVNVVRDDKQWRKAAWWPAEFPKQDLLHDDSEEDDSDVAGKMPPSDSEDDLDMKHTSI